MYYLFTLNQNELHPIFSFFNRLETGVESWRIKNYNIYYGFNQSYKCNDNFEILNGKLFDNIKRVVQFYWHHKSEVSCNRLGWGTKHNSKNNKDLLTTGKAAAKRHIAKSKSFFIRLNLVWPQGKAAIYEQDSLP